jgi:hypothetical protein
VAVATVASVVAAAPAGARADDGDDKRACGVTYALTQTLRQAGKLTAARRPAMICSRDTCAEFIRTDCARWLAEIDASQPTVVFEVRDAAGLETTAVRVELDGKPWIDRLDGKAAAVDPGLHKLHFVLAGGGEIDDTVQIREGEKNRKLTASFQNAGSPAPLGDGAAPPVSEPGGEPQRRSVAPWVIGGVGLAALAVGGILAGVVAADKSTTENPHNCNQKAPFHCNGAGLSAFNQARTLGPVSTVGFIVGGVGVAAGVVWLAARGPAKASAPPAAVGIGPVLSASSAGLRLQGSW